MISFVPGEQQERRLFSHHLEDKGSVGMYMDAQLIFTRSRVAVYSCFRGGFSIINLSTGAYFRLEGIGFQIWNILERPSTIFEIKAKLVDDGMSETDLEDALLAEFIESLRRAGLVAVR